MAKVIEVPGQGPVEFPDSMTDDQIVTAIQKMPKAPEQAVPKAAPQVAPQVDPETNVRKFLDFLGRAENADYNTVVGGGRFADFTRHPKTVGLTTKEGPSTAAGKYQITGTTYDDVAPKLGIRDFSPDSQDRIAVELIRRNGALEDVRKGDFQSAINKLGGTWASLPSSPYSQSKRSQEWVQKELGQPYTFQNFGPVRSNIDPKSLNSDQDWLKASMLMYNFWERKPFQGTQDELAEWGKDSLGMFNYNLVSMAEIAYALRNASPEEKEAFLYMMDTYDNTNISWEGAGRAAKAMGTDPTNLVGLGTLGLGTLAKIGVQQGTKVGTKMAIRDLVLKSLARTGIAAGIEGAVFNAADSTIRQSVEVDAGRRQEIDLSKVGVDATIGAAAGVALGTAGDLAVSQIYKLVKGRGGKVASEIPVEAPRTPQEAPKDVSGVSPKAEVENVLEAPALYRGQPSQFKDLQRVENTDAIDNILIGRGIFTTTDKEMASTYGPNLFKFEIPSAERVFDISSATEEQLRKVMPESFFKEERLGLYRDGPVTSGLKTYEYYRDTGKLKEAEEFLFESLVEKYLPPDVSWTEVKKGLAMDKGILPDELRDKISADLQAAGFDFVKHRGGIRAGKGEKQHEVYIALRDNVLVETNKAGKVQAVGGSQLTPAEQADVFARKQDGRLRADEIVPTVGEGTPRIEVPEMNTGLRTTRLTDEPTAKLSKAELSETAQSVVEQLRNVETKDLPAVLETVRNGQYSLEEHRVVAKAIQDFSNELKTDLATAIKERDALLAKGALNEEQAAKVADLGKRIEDLETRAASPALTDDAYGSMAGSILQDRQDPMNALKSITVESIMKEQGLPKKEAEQVWAEMVGKLAQDSEAAKITAKFDEQAAQALERGDLKGAVDAVVQKLTELGAKSEQVAPKSASLVQKLTEFAISNVFSVKTLLINVIPSGIKTLVIPGLKAVLSNPFEKATRMEAAAAYSAMRSSFGSAMAAARAGFRYEQALLTRDGTRLVEGELALKGKLAGAWRIFPRLLNASDEFMSRINYDSFIAGREAAKATMEATEKGLKGKDLNEYVDKAVKSALDAALKPVKGDELVQPIINKGVNLGYSGDDLIKYVEREAMRDPKALRKGNDEEALNFVRDVLYKRKFSGENGFSKAAQWYEDGMNKFPTMKLVIGQLFFRTPIRVFEEGVRLTPGLQFVAPGFMKDLAGANGTLRQVRAQAEAMSSLVIASAVLSLYAQGRITGDGAYSDYKQSKTRIDGGLPEPYTIKMSDGSTWSYRGFDPLATPIKIMINALERRDKLRIHEAQGEFDTKGADKQLLAAISVATQSIASAIRDASLVEGVDNTMKTVKMIFKPDEGEDAFIKALGDKLFLLVPNTLHKIARDNDPQVKDPTTFWQMVEQKLLRPFGAESPYEKSAYAYDVLGNVRKSADTGALWNVFSTATVEERNKGLSDKELYVLQEMDRLSRVTGVTFKPPVKAPDLGDFDMRTVMASDGKRTLYDVWQQNYKALHPENILEPILKSPMPEGTFKYRAAKVEEAQSIIRDLQQTALLQTMQQEGRVIKEYQDNILRKAQTQGGLFDTPRPY